MGYLFRVEDSDELVEVDFSKMMEQDSSGYITLPCGSRARRCVHLELERDGRPVVQRREELTPPILSDSLGFPQQQLAEMERDRRAHGFAGIEFVRDRRVPEFIQVKGRSGPEWERYIRHRGMRNQNSVPDVMSPEELERARAAINRRLDRLEEDS